jgi:hypothetical protein
MTKILALLAISPLALAACGSDKPSSAGPDDSDAARVKFEQCLRDGGINVQSAGAGGERAMKVTVKVGKGGSPAKFQRVQEECQKKSGFKPQPPSEAEQAEFKDAALKFARCMRAHGINMPDPKEGPGGGMLQRGPQGVNPNSPRFRTAQNECGKLLPGGKGPGAPATSVKP